MSVKTVEPSPEPRRRETNGSILAGRLAGAVGLVLLVTTPLTYLISGAMDAAVWTKLLLGLACVATYAATNGKQLVRFGGSRSTPLLALSGGSVIAVFAVLAALNYAGAKHPGEIDVTREGIYTLSDQTVGMLERLDKPVKIYAFYTADDREYALVQETLKRYAAKTDKLTFALINPNNRPDLVSKYSLQQGAPRIIVTQGETDARVKSPVEEELTNAITSVTRGESKVVYFLTGHGETELDDDKKGGGAKLTADAVRSEGLDVKPLNLATADAAAMGAKVAIDEESAVKPLSIPADAEALVIAGPRAKLFDPEVAAIEAYLNGGGRVIALLDPRIVSNLEGLLRQYKIGLHDDMVVDTNPMNQLLGYSAGAVLVHPAGEHPATDAMAAPALLPLGRSLVIEDGGEAGVVTTPLLVSDASAWGETDYKGGSAERDKNDIQGPVTMAAIAVKPTGEAKPEARLVVFGASGWVTNQFRDVQANPDLFLNVLAWLTEQTDKITIRPKTRAASQLLLTGNQMNTLILASMDVLPVVLIALGVGIVLIRRQR